jgi:erythromycin esterase
MRRALVTLLLFLAAAAPAVAQSSASPMGPLPSQALLDDAALRIEASDVPTVPPAWAADIRARRQPLRSLSSDNFSDLQFLKPLLERKRVVLLGESGHGVAEFNLAKVRLVKFLHQQMGYGVIAFESSLSQCHQADKAIGTVDPARVMHGCIFGMWHSAEVLALFDYLAQTRNSGRPLTLAGFDTQDSAGPAVHAMSGLGAMLDALKSPLGAELAANEKRLARTPRAKLDSASVARLAAFYEAAADAIAGGRAQLAAAGRAAEEIELAAQSARSRASLVRLYGVRAGSPEGTAIRDAGMAANLDFVLDRLYPKRKVIVWSHNAHIAYQQPAGLPKPMGAYVAQRRKAEAYSIGLYMGRGVAQHNNGARYRIDAPQPGTMEAVLANGGAKYAFVDFASARNSPGAAWMFAPIRSRDWGTTPVTLTPAQSYDALLYIDSVTPPVRR